MGSFLYICKNDKIMKRKKAKIEKLKAINDINEKIIEAMSNYIGCEDSEVCTKLSHGFRVSALVNRKRIIQSQPLPPKVKGDCGIVGEGKEVIVDRESDLKAASIKLDDIDNHAIDFTGHTLNTVYQYTKDYKSELNRVKLIAENTKLAERCAELEKENKQYKTEREQDLINVDLLHQLCYKHIPDNEVFEYMNLIVKL